MNMYDMILSKNYDCMYSLEELIKYNNGMCLLDVNYKKHKSDNCFGQFMLLFESPKKEDSYIEIGIAEDGFVYAGDKRLFSFNEYKKIDVKEAIPFMLKYKNMINSIRSFELDLGGLVDNNECINILYENTYYKENSQSIEFKFKK